MNNESNSGKKEKEKNMNPENVFKLILRELPDREFNIKVTESRLASVVSTLSKHFVIEIE